MAKKHQFGEAPDPYSASGPDGTHVEPPIPPPSSEGPEPVNPTQHTVIATAAEDRLWATLTHLSVFLAPFLGPLVLFLIFKDTHQRVNRAGRAALNFQISLILWTAISGIFSALIIGIPFLIFFGIMGIVLPIIAAMKTNQGQDYTYPFSIKFL